jgi:hypothetical protein
VFVVSATISVPQAEYAFQTQITIALTQISTGATASASGSVTQESPPLTLNASSIGPLLAGTAFSGQIGGYILGSQDGGYTPTGVTIDWGDGSAIDTTTGSAFVEGHEVTGGPFTYSTPGTYALSITALDPSNNVVSDTAYPMVVFDPASLLSFALRPPFAFAQHNCGYWYSSTASFVPTVTVDYGDGVGAQAATASNANTPAPSGGGIRTAVAPVWTSGNTYTVTIAGLDPVGTPVTLTASVVAP